MSKEQLSIEKLEKARDAALKAGEFRRFGELSAQISQLTARVQVPPVKEPELAAEEEKIFPKETATATMMAAIVELDEDGNFLHRDKLSVARQLLFPELRNREDLFPRALNNFHARRGFYREAIRGFVEKNGNPRTMFAFVERYEKDLAKKGSVIAEAWIPFFSTVKVSFGSLSPNDFIGKVLNRFETFPAIESAEEATGFISIARLAKRMKLEPDVLRELVRKDILRPGKDFNEAGRNILFKNEVARRLRRAAKRIPEFLSVTPSVLAQAYELALKKEREHRSAMAGFKVVDITPADEIALGGILTRGRMLENISQGILDGEDPLNILRNYHPPAADVVAHIILGLEEVALLRHAKPISTEEHKHSLTAIESFIERLSSGPDLRKMPKEFRAFRFLLELIRNIRHNPQKVMQLRNMLIAGTSWWEEHDGGVTVVS